MKKIGDFSCKLLIISLLAFLSGNALRAHNTTSPHFYAEKWQEIDLLTPQDSTLPAPISEKEAKKKEKAERRKNRKVTFETFEYNYGKAVEFYNKKQYLSAARLLEALYPLSMGTQMADSILFMFADCYYQNQDFEMATFHFKDYVRRYPGDARTEQAYYKALQALYHLSPYYALDQTETKYAIEEINTFITLYPYSELVPECNKMLDVLQEKMAKKEFELLKLYFETENYKAAQISITNFLKDYSFSQYAAEASFILVKNNFLYAKKSVAHKMKGRFQECVDAYRNLAANFPESKFVEEGKKYLDDSIKQIEKIDQKNK